MPAVAISAERIVENLDQVQERIERSAQRSGRSSDSISVVAVTKAWPAELVRHAHQAGLRRFGENRVAEAQAKRQLLADLTDAIWDMVGHIQSRKAQSATEVFDRIHSVDRWKIARLLNQHLPQDRAPLPVLLECNMSGEGSKYGYDMAEPNLWGQLLPELEQIAALDRLRVVGLMTMAPWTENEAVIRSTFGQLRRLRDWLSERMPQVEWRELSMGMTDDFEIAIEEGATILRIGRALFGDRPS